MSLRGWPGGMVPFLCDTQRKKKKKKREQSGKKWIKVRNQTLWLGYHAKEDERERIKKILEEIRA